MHQDIWDLEERWADLLWIAGVATCRWPLVHPIGIEASTNLAQQRKHLLKAARVLARVAGHSPCCSKRLEETVDANLLPGRWGETWEEIAATAATVCRPILDTWPKRDDSALVFSALKGSLAWLCLSVLARRTQCWERWPRRMERAPIGQLLTVAVIVGWLLPLPWRQAVGTESLRRSLKVVVDGAEILNQLSSEPPIGLEHCVVEAHQWLRTGELGQSWMDHWRG